MLIATTAIPALGVLGGWLQFGAFGLLAAVLFYGLRTLLPQTLGAIAKMEKTMDRQCDALRRLTVVILLHDATVRGKNPETLGTTDDIIRRVFNDGD
jgi:hypothetical protein